MKELISSVEEGFVREALLEEGGLRADGRRTLDYRPVRISFASQFGQVEVQLGRTRCLASSPSSL